MALFIGGQSPDKIRSGSSLIKQSTPGTRISTATIAESGTSTNTMTAGSIGGFIFVLSVFPHDLPTINQSATTAIPQTSLFATNNMDFFVDTNNNTGYMALSGASLSAEQQKVNFEGTWYLNTQGGSYTWNAIMRNNGASSHTVYCGGYWKYFVIGEEGV